MEENLNNVVSGGDVTEEIDSAKYIETIKTLKENTVSRESYLKLQEENKQLLDAYASGSGYAAAQPQEEKVPLSELKSHLMKEGISNLDYATTALELRNRVLDESGYDMFVPNGDVNSATADEVNKANIIANMLQEMIEAANGDCNVFNNEVDRRIKPSPLPQKKTGK